MREGRIPTLKVASSAVQAVAVQALHAMPNMLHEGKARGKPRVQCYRWTAGTHGTSAAQQAGARAPNRPSRSLGRLKW